MAVHHIGAFAPQQAHQRKPRPQIERSGPVDLEDVDALSSDLRDDRRLRRPGDTERPLEARRVETLNQLRSDPLAPTAASDSIYDCDDTNL